MEGGSGNRGPRCGWMLWCVEILISGLMIVQKGNAVMLSSSEVGIDVGVNVQREAKLEAWISHVRKTSDWDGDGRDEFVVASSMSKADSLMGMGETVVPKEDTSRVEFSANLTDSAIDISELLYLDSLQPDSRELLSGLNNNKFKPYSVIYVSKDGSGDFTSVQRAVDHVPKKNVNRVIIRIKAGIYREKVTIPKNKPYITFQGDGARSVIMYNATASDLKNNRPLRTYRSATVAVNSKFFIAHDMVFMNTAPAPAPGAIGKQAVAFRISADMAAFYNCKFYGTQDTLYDHHGRHYFKNCYIRGTVDFIFGNGRSLYRNCNLHALSNSGMPGSLTAQKRNETTLDTGFSFVNATIDGSGLVYLGRAWGNDSRVVFSYTYMDDVIIPIGWNDWGIPHREKTVYYAEYKCYGAGSHNRQRASWSRVLTFGEVEPFLTVGFINGKKWLSSI